ncbi:putative N-methylcoclaurine 3'-monooxygenase [Helianthus annuus]|uniref:N-methylcoclaurine 3'-monooxygenase n=1 Tax=Helianthus annuus TaxID=4232 RepID=A0A251SQ14_HELAN|nr:probable (S)-N-methylcoclaurine 3'-hydroxylase isozyme 2 [Helianthus annuus]KAF5772381.1 putative N-methylcoclaurine 3'-monooxygenase [Helianthus annuus]KAJ0476006.1 putative N-methylcoclaurine 3'-monooxygenase [Helianthus annuus]KAJ0496810.1 putative N-methylcoclaurine 3'-monooxygenase [Helianthus annuus]
MNIKVFLTENLSSPIFILSTFLFLFFLIKQTKWLFSQNIINLPPGPPKLPIIGNLHQVGDQLHVSLAKFAQEYGPLISLKLGTKILVVASSPEAAKGILKTQDRHLSSRVVPTAMQQKSLLPHSILFSECNESWRTLRSLCRAEMFSSNALEAHSRLREEKIDQLLEFLHKKQGQVINARDIVFTTLFNTLSCIVFGKDFLDLEKENETFVGVKRSILMILEYVSRVKDFGSFFPVFQRFDLQGIRKGGMKHIQEVFDFWKDTIEERKVQMSSSTSSSRQSKFFLDRLLENGFSDDRINEYVTELFVAGTNTTTTSLVWAMAEIVKNQDVVKRIEEEMKREIGSNKIKVSQLSKLPYLQACVKESLRLHPPVPFLLPRLAVETCEVMNYTIPKNAQIFVNVWAIGRDPNVWDDPLSFKPERFLVSDLDFKGQDFELLPFGSGRRICPSLPLGSKSMEFIIASLVHEFDWVLPDIKDPSQLDMEERFQITLGREKPLKLIFKQKQGSTEV